MSLGVGAPWSAALGWWQQPLGDVVTNRAHRHVRCRGQLAQREPFDVRRSSVQHILIAEFVLILEDKVLDFAIRPVTAFPSHGIIITVIRTTVNTRSLLDSGSVTSGRNEETWASDGAV